MWIKMRRRTIVGSALALVTALCAWLFWAPGRPTAEVVCPEGHPIVIDPGHGGIDGGTGAAGMLEKDVVLDISLRAQRYLNQFEVPVVLTRTTDVDLGGRYDGGRLKRDLTYRARLANQCQASLLVSLHINSSRSASESGMLIFYQRGSTASRDAGVLFDRVFKSRGLHSRNEPAYANNTFFVLRASRGPSVLLEMGFVTHQEDRAKLADEAYREKLGQSIAHVCLALYRQWVN